MVFMILTQLPDDDADHVSAETCSSEDERSLPKTTAYQHAPAAAAAQLGSLFAGRPLGLCDIPRRSTGATVTQMGLALDVRRGPRRFRLGEIGAPP